MNQMVIVENWNSYIRHACAWLILVSVFLVAWTIVRSLNIFGVFDIIYVAIGILCLLISELTVILFVCGLSVSIGHDVNLRMLRFIVCLMTMACLIINVNYYIFPTTSTSISGKISVFILLIATSALYLTKSKVRLFLGAFVMVFSISPLLISLTTVKVNALTGAVATSDFSNNTGVSLSDHSFHNAKNVYLLVFDSLISDLGAQSLLGISNLEWSTELDSLGFRLVSNSTAAGNLTIPSFASTLSMAHVEDLGGLNVATYFGGSYPIPGYVKFRELGYKIQFLFDTDFFGYRTGRFVDYFYPERSSGGGVGICIFTSQKYGLFLCRPPFISAINKYFNVDFRNFSSGDASRVLLERLLFTSSDRYPWLTIAYFFTPGHTPSGPEIYNYNDLLARNKFIQEFPQKAKQTSILIRHLVSEITVRDPNSIIFVYGDHGPYVTRGWGGAEDHESQKSLLYLDRESVTAAVWPSNFCLPINGTNYDLTYLLKDVLECLRNSG